MCNHRRRVVTICRFGLVLCVVALSGCTAEKKVWMSSLAHAAASPIRRSSAANGILRERAVTVTVTVQEIDPQTRRLTLRRSDGTPFTIAVAPDESNLLALALASDVDDLERFEVGIGRHDEEVPITSGRHPRRRSSLARNAKTRRAPNG
jgi:hypothetical protein